MTITLPRHLDAFRYVVGFDFPEADEDALRRCAHAWRAAAGGVRAERAEAQTAGTAIGAALGGDAGAAFAAAWHELWAPDSGLLDQVAVACDQVAGACEHAAEEVEYAKYEFIGVLTLFAAVLGYLLATWFLGGFSAAAIPAAIATAQVSIRAILVRLVVSVVVAEAFTVGLDGLAQGMQMLRGHRGSWDWDHTARAAEDGVVFGTVNGLTFAVAGRLAPSLLSTRTGSFGVASAAGAAGMESDALLHGELPRGGDFLLSLTSSLAGGALDAGHARVHRADAAHRLVSDDWGGLDSSTMDHLAGYVDAADGPAADTDPRRPADPGGGPGGPHLAGGSRGTHPAAADAAAGPGDHPAVSPHDTGAPTSDRPIGGTVTAPEGAVHTALSSGGPAGSADVLRAGGSGMSDVATGAAADTTPSHSPADSAEALAAPHRPSRSAPPGPVAPSDSGWATSDSGRATSRPEPHPNSSPTRVPDTSAGARPSDGPAPTGAVGVAPVDPGRHLPASTSDAHDPSGTDAVGPASPDPFRVLTDAEARRLVQENVFATDAGLGFYADGDTTRDFARAVEPTEGYVTLDLHGAKDGFYIDGHRITPEQLADSLRTLYAEGMFDLPGGMGVKLLSCDTAFGGVDSPAAALARALGVAVIAPDRVVWTSMAGEEVVSSPAMFGGYLIPTYPPDGAWHRFDPYGDEVPLAFDPGYHGPAVDPHRPLSQFHSDEVERVGADDEEAGGDDPYAGNAEGDHDAWRERTGPRARTILTDARAPRHDLSGGRPGRPA